MTIDLLPIEDFIKANYVKQVTNPVALDGSGVFTPDGIYSYDIFGYSIEDRKNNFAYIDLQGNYLHPQVYKTLLRMGSLGKIISRIKYAIVVDKKIKVLSDEEKDNYPDAETGIEFFYDNWENIDWKKSSLKEDDNPEDLSIDKRNRIDFLRMLKKNEAFVSKWLVLPAYYRDYDTSGNTSDDINKLYTELISKTNSMKSGFGLTLFDNVTRDRIQNLIVLIYMDTLNPVSGKSVDLDTGDYVGNAKSSLVRRNLMGRFLDYAFYSVITAPVSSTSRGFGDFVKFGDCLVPLQGCISMYFPFFEKYITDYLEGFANTIKFDRNLDIDSIDPAQYSKDTVNNILSRFMKTGSNKDDTVYIEVKLKNGKKLKRFIVIDISDDPDMKGHEERYLTWIELLYMAAEDICADKYLVSTRYPLTNNNNIYCAKTKVNSTNKVRTKYVKVPGTEFGNIRKYERYPCIDYKNQPIDDPEQRSKVDSDLYRVTVIGNGVIKAHLGPAN